MKVLVQNGYRLQENLEGSKRDPRRYNFTCLSTGRGYDFGSCHTECTEAFKNNSLTKMIETYSELAKVEEKKPQWFGN